MTLIRKMAGAGALFAVAALMLASFAASTASAQPTSPMKVYGVTGAGDIVEGDEIEIFVDGESVGTTTATADGWVFDIQNGENDAAVTFTINGEAAAETVAYEGFGQSEVSLTIGEDTGEPTDGGETPEPAETGNAGLLGSTGTSLALVLALGVFAAAMVAGGRTATRRS